MDPCFIIGIDLGTTNVAAFLIDLQTGERLASLGLENPQTGLSETIELTGPTWVDVWFERREGQAL